MSPFIRKLLAVIIALYALSQGVMMLLLHQAPHNSMALLKNLMLWSKSIIPLGCLVLAYGMFTYRSSEE